MFFIYHAKQAKKEEEEEAEIQINCVYGENVDWELLQHHIASHCVVLWVREGKVFRILMFFWEPKCVFNDWLHRELKLANIIIIHWKLYNFSLPPASAAAVEAVAPPPKKNPLNLWCSAYAVSEKC